MDLSPLGYMVEACWYDVPNHHPYVNLHKVVIMPNHLHGIVEIAKLDSHLNKNNSQTLGSVIRGFKIGVTKWARQNTEIYDVWQRNYYEHIIRNETAYLEIWDYIENNPILWEKDRFFIK